MSLIRIALLTALALPVAASAQTTGSTGVGGTTSTSIGGSSTVGNEIRAPRPGVDSTVGVSSGTTAGSGPTSPGVDADADRRAKARASGTGGAGDPGMATGVPGVESANKRAVDKLTPTTQPVGTPTTPGSPQ